MKNIARMIIDQELPKDFIVAADVKLVVLEAHALGYDEGFAAGRSDIVCKHKWHPVFKGNDIAGRRCMSCNEEEW